MINLEATILQWTWILNERTIELERIKTIAYNGNDLAEYNHVDVRIAEENVIEAEEAIAGLKIVLAHID